MSRKELIGCIVGIIAIVSVCFGLYFWFSAEFVHASDLSKALKSMEKMGVRLDLKITQDQLHEVQKDIQAIEDRYCPDKTKSCNESKMPVTVREWYKKLKAERDELQNEVERLKNKRLEVIK